MGMSCVAVLYQSIPHVWAIFVTHIIAALWSAFQLWSTRAFKARYSGLINDHNLDLLRGRGACAGQDMLPAYFNPRMNAELASAVFNFVSVFTSGYLAYRLIYVFGWNTFKHIGASVVIHKVHKLILTLTILIQLSLFNIVVSVVRPLLVHLDCSEIRCLGAMDRPIVFVRSSLSTMLTSCSWSSSGLFGRYATFLGLYRAWNIVILIGLIPWLTLGWFSVRREWRHRMLVFNILSAFFLMSWLGMHLPVCFTRRLIGFTAVILSSTWRLTFLNWRFFSIIQVVAFASCLLTFVFGILCRVFCFKEQLPQYPNPTDATVHDFKCAPHVQSDTEKVAFPGLRGPILQFTKPPRYPSTLRVQLRDTTHRDRRESRVSDLSCGASRDRRNPKEEPIE